MDLQQKKIVVLGAGRSGLALVRLIQRAGGVAYLSDSRKPTEVPAETKLQLAQLNVTVEFGQHTSDFVCQADIVVLSPGVSVNSEVTKMVLDQHIPVMGEIEFAFQFAVAPVLAVTGSNGKTTVVNLLHQVLLAAGYRSCLCGNVGFPFSDYCLSQQEYDYYVLEVSSFQLESLLPVDHPWVRSGQLRGFRPRLGMILNFTENHLDRHADLDEYFEAKWKMFQNHHPDDFVVLNQDDARLKLAAKKLSGQIRFFAKSGSGEQNQNPNFNAVRAAADLLQIDSQVVNPVLDSFTGVEHRLESVRQLEGVSYVNDSKATTAESGRWALNQLDAPVIMICGGRDKNIDFASLKSLVQDKVKRMIVIGEAKDKLRNTFGDVVEVQACDTLEDAVFQARTQSNLGDKILFSPMCASFDMFKNFEHRGEAFKKIVQELT